MAAITQIVETERQNYDRIHLFREGLFLKAYQHSAFLFINNVKYYKAVKKFYKATNCDVVMIGFPSVLLTELFPEGGVEQVDQWHFCVRSSGPFDREGYRQWFETVENAPEKKPRTQEQSRSLDRPELPITVRVYEAESQVTSAGSSDKVIKELEAFSIENSTPMECMIFLSKLKSELKKGTSGGL